MKTLTNSLQIYSWKKEKNIYNNNKSDCDVKYGSIPGPTEPIVLIITQIKATNNSEHLLGLAKLAQVGHLLVFTEVMKDKKKQR